MTTTEWTLISAEFQKFEMNSSNPRVYPEFSCIKKELLHEYTSKTFQYISNPLPYLNAYACTPYQFCLRILITMTTTEVATYPSYWNVCDIWHEILRLRPNKIAVLQVKLNVT